MVMMVPIVVVGTDVRRELHLTAWKPHRDLAAPDAAPHHRFDFNGLIGDTETCRKAGKPIARSTGVQQGAQQHVSADSGGRIQNSELVTGHRLKYRSE